MSPAYYFVEPLDVLALGGARGQGSAFEARATPLPPWPSVFAGAFRSALLGSDAARLAAFTALDGEPFEGEAQRARRTREVLGEGLFDTLGTPRHPGAFRIAWLSLATLGADGVAQPALPAPADLQPQADGAPARWRALQPAALSAGVRCGGGLPMVAAQGGPVPDGPPQGWWLAGGALLEHLHGREPAAALPAAALYRSETRVAAALDGRSRVATAGAPSTRTVLALSPGTGFLVGVEGAPQLAGTGLLRLGGDGHGARWRRVRFERPGAPLRQAWRFRLLLTTPALFAQGWLPDGVAREADGSLRLRGDGFSARLACAAVPRPQPIAGWDLARGAPKAAQRAVPAGAVYWFDRFEGDGGRLAQWVAGGLWPPAQALGAEARQRRAEGFNNALLGTWA